MNNHSTPEAKRIDQMEQSTEQVADLILWAVINTQKDLKSHPSRQHRFMKAKILDYLEHDRAQTERRVRRECIDKLVSRMQGNDE